MTHPCPRTAVLVGEHVGFASTRAADLEQAERLEQAMQTLTPMQRDALRLHHVEGLAFPAIAERLGITLKQARWSVYKAKFAMARVLGQEDSRPERP